MRLWHKDLIPVLPRKQLVGQWRECCLIAKNIAEKGTPNHILVNRIMDYPLEHFYEYTCIVANEMRHRGYSCNTFKFANQFEKIMDLPFYHISFEKLFSNWHNDRYLRQCYFNLQEKYDCGGIDETEWNVLKTFFEKR